jgi:hypothetical protein
LLPGIVTVHLTLSDTWESIATVTPPAARGVMVETCLVIVVSMAAFRLPAMSDAVSPLLIASLTVGMTGIVELDAVRMSVSPVSAPVALLSTTVNEVLSVVAALAGGALSDVVIDPSAEPRLHSA